MALTNAVFISYRRDVGWSLAQLVYQQLRAGTEPVDVFYDVESDHHAGVFNVRLLEQIRVRPYFVLVLVPGTLERCVSPKDWLRREIEHAVETDRSIVPLFGPGFDVADVHAHLPPEAADRVAGSQGIRIYHEYFGEAMTHLRTTLLVPVETDVALSAAGREYEQQVRRELASRPTVRPAEVLGASDPDSEPPSRSQEPVEPPSMPPPPPPSPTPWFRRHVALIGVVAAVVVAAVVAALVLSSSDGGRGGAEAGTADVTTTARRTSTADLGDETDRSDDATTELVVGAQLRRGEYIESSNGAQRLTMNGDGELEASDRDGDVWWQQPTALRRGDRVVVQRDGNVVVYTAGGQGVWASGTSASGVVLRVVDIDGRGVVELRDRDGNVVWAVEEGPPGERATLRAGDELRPGDRLVSTDGQHVLELTAAGVLEASTAGRVWWRENDGGTPADHLAMQPDGNLVLYAPNGDVLWKTGTEGVDDGGTYATLRSSDGRGQFAIADSGSTVRWAVDDAGPAPAQPRSTDAPVTPRPSTTAGTPTTTTSVTTTTSSSTTTTSPVTTTTLVLGG